VVHEYEMSRQAQKGINCLDCHQPGAGLEKQDHHAVVIVKGHLPLATATVAMKRSISSFVRGRPCSAGVGGDLWGKRSDARTGSFFREVSPLRNPASAASLLCKPRADRRWPADLINATA